MRTTILPVLLCLLALSLAGCGDEATLPEMAGVGPNPKLPPPKETLIPTVNIAPHKGWPAGGKPTPTAGLFVAAFAAGLDHPRWLTVLPNGDVLVAESNSPAKADGGLEGMAKKVVLWLVGAGVPSPNRITLLRDADGDGIAEVKSTFLSGLNSPFGMQRSTSPTPTRCCAFPIARVRQRSMQSLRRSPISRQARLTCIGPRTSSPAPTV